MNEQKGVKHVLDSWYMLWDPQKIDKDTEMVHFN